MTESIGELNYVMQENGARDPAYLATVQPHREHPPLPGHYSLASHCSKNSSQEMKPISHRASSLEWVLLLMPLDTGGLQRYPKAEGIREGSHIQHSATK